jgi:hypothetical protein
MFALPPVSDSLFVSNTRDKPVPAITTHTVHQHTWWGRQIHVLTTKGEVLRATCGELLLAKGHVAVKVTFTSHGKSKKKYVSPISIVTLHILWLSRDIVSDDDDDDVEDPTSVDDTPVVTHTTTILPPLAIDRTVQPSLSPDNIIALGFICTQVAGLLKIV